jgi:hypothetical protein
MTPLQLTLPFPRRHNFWPQCIRCWMRDANAGAQYNRYAFYNLKDKLFRRFGAFLGYNFQIIKRECWTCSGTGDFHWWLTDRYRKCEHCNGTGIFRIDYVLLERYSLFGDIYHKPIRLRDVQRFGRLGNTIKGIIQHKQVTSKRAWVSMMALLFLFDQNNFWNNFGIFLSRFAKERLFRKVRHAVNFLSDCICSVGYKSEREELLF